jgi:hypothetical protein
VPVEVFQQLVPFHLGAVPAWTESGTNSTRSASGLCASSDGTGSGFPGKTRINDRRQPETRYTVGLPSSVASQVQRYAETVDVSMSKAITALVRLGLQSQEDRKRDFFKRLKENLGNDDPENQDRLVDEFRTLILGR